MTLEKLKELRKLLTEYELQIDPVAREEERVIIQQANEVVHEDIKDKEEEKYSGKGGELVDLNELAEKLYDLIQAGLIEKVE